MVAVRAPSAPPLGRDGYASDPEAIVARRDADAKGSQRIRHGLDAVRFLDAQLLVRPRRGSPRARTPAASANSGSSSTSRGTSSAVDGGRGQLGRAHLEVADRLARRSCAG